MGGPCSDLAQELWDWDWESGNISELLCDPRGKTALEISYILLLVPSQLLTPPKRNKPCSAWKRIPQDSVGPRGSQTHKSPKRAGSKEIRDDIGDTTLIESLLSPDIGDKSDSRGLDGQSFTECEGRFLKSPPQSPQAAGVWMGKFPLDLDENNSTWIWMRTFPSGFGWGNSMWIWIRTFLPGFG